MAEFCLDCWNEINGTKHSKRKYVMSKELDLCEECGEWKQVIICYRKGRLRRRIRVFFARLFGKIWLFSMKYDIIDAEVMNNGVH